MLEILAEHLTINLLSNNENLHNVTKDSLESIVKNELFQILQPTLATLSSQNYEPSFSYLSSNASSNLLKIAEGRISRVGDIVDCTIEAWSMYCNKKFLNQKQEAFDLKALSGDSHRGGFRPFILKANEIKPMVIKFADPRPYQILAEILAGLSQSLSIDLIPPPCFAAPDNRWYFTDYIDEKDSDICSDPAVLMFGMGVLTSVAFSLGFVDLHLENVIVMGSKPIIIDPECIFYCFSESETISERLLNTGFLSHNVHLSALRGGISESVPLYDFSLCVGSNGLLHFRKPVSMHRNKIRLADGLFADPCNYRDELLAGYCAGYRWFIENANQVSSLIDKHVPDDFRVRFLARKTRHYASVIYMLNLEIEEDYDAWVEHVFKRFCGSGYFPESISKKLLSAEIEDLKRRDIPYFWLKAGENGIVMHQSGTVHHLNLKDSLKNMAISHLQTLHNEDLAEHISIINNFLDIDISLPSN